MNKKLLVAAILAALTVSTTTTFASPTFTGEARILTQKDEGAHTTTDTRFRLNADSEIGDGFYAHARIQGLDEQSGVSQFATGASQGVTATMDQLYLGTKMGAVDVKAGRQGLFVGNGILADVNVQGMSLATDSQNIGFEAFLGRSGTDDVTAANLKTKGDVVDFSVGYLQKDDVKYLALNADRRLNNNMVLSGNYVKNNTDNANGFLVKATVGEAAHKGEFNYALSYRNIEDKAVDGGWSTDSAYNDSKGFRVEANYKFADNVNINVFKDFTDKNSDATALNRAKAELTVIF
ncbi:MAG: hypothetical protein H6Q74_585 [Firmicutes bacterium]|nr:hypothetical protein [Bacillota bacterium]